MRKNKLKRMFSGCLSAWMLVSMPLYGKTVSAETTAEDNTVTGTIPGYLWLGNEGRELEYRYEPDTRALYLTGDTSSPYAFSRIAGFYYFKANELMDALGDVKIDTLFADSCVQTFADTYLEYMDPDIHVYCYSWFMTDGSRSDSVKEFDENGYNYTLLDTVHEGNTYWGYCGEDFLNIKWTYDADTRTITFSGTGKMMDYYGQNHSGDPQWRCCSGYNADNVVIEEGITDIGENGFYFYGLKRDNPRSLTAGESLTNAKFSCGLTGNDITYYGKTGSWLQSQVRECQFVSIGEAENPICEAPPVSGTLNDDVIWAYDMEHNRIFIGGAGSVSYLDIIQSELGTAMYEFEPDLYIGDNVSITADKQRFIQTFRFLDDCTREELIVYYTSQGASANAIIQNDTLIPEVHFVCTDNHVLYGDINQDGKVDITDAVMLGKAVNGSIFLTDAQALAADCNSDESVDATDSYILMQFLLNAIQRLPYIV